eukprot:1634987-Prymnesium_polylepis.1
MDEALGHLDPPAQLVPDILRFDCLEMGYDGIAAITELGASIKDQSRTPPPPNSLVQTWPAVMREA